MKKKKLKYILEARLPFPSQQMTLCVRAEGNDNNLRRTAFSALQQLFEVKCKKIGLDIHGLAHKKSARARDANGRYMKKPVLREEYPRESQTSPNNTSWLSLMRYTRQSCLALGFQSVKNANFLK